MINTIENIKEKEKDVKQFNKEIDIKIKKYNYRIVMAEEFSTAELMRMGLLEKRTNITIEKVMLREPTV